MTKLRNNVLANLSGQAISVIMAVVFLPIYIRILGIEAFGLIGFYMSLQAFFTVLDMGLSPTLSRELARYSHTGVDADQQRDLVRTLECLYWPMGLLLAFAVAAISQPIASHWLKPVTLSIAQTKHAIVLMGIATALQFPTALYGGGFRGLERQVTLIIINSSLSVVRSVGAVVVLMYISPTLEAYLWWQVAVAAAQTFISRWVLWNVLPTGTRMAIFCAPLLRDLRGFTLGLTGVTAMSFLLMQSDRIILSKLLPLTEFGYYALASTVAAVLSTMIGPFFNALYPRFSGLVGAGREDELTRLYHSSNQVLSVLISSVAAVLAFFAVDALRLWTHDPQLAIRTGPILSLLVVGTAIHGLLHLPYALQLAYGWTRLALYQTAASTIFVVPAIWWLAQHYGAVGAASVWMLLNLASLIFVVPIMHRKLLRHEMGIWYRRDILPSVAVAVGCAGLARVLVSEIPDGLLGIGMLAVIGMSTMSLTALFSPVCRSSLSPLRESFHALFHRLRP